MGRSTAIFNSIPTKKSTKMAFYIYEQPAFTMEHFHPAFSQPLRTLGKSSHWNLIENLFDQKQKSFESNQHCSRTESVKKSMEKSPSSSVQEEKMEAQISKSNDENKIVEPVTKTTSKQFSPVSVAMKIWTK